MSVLHNIGTTAGGPPSRGEVFSALTEYLRKAEECAASLAHLTTDDDHLQAQGWLAIAQMFRNVNKVVIDLATKGRLN